MQNSPKTLIILGSRGVPGRYGGFETLATVLKDRLTGLDLGVEVRASAFSSPFKGLNRALETILGTLQSSRGIPPGTIVLILNPINVLTAISVKASGCSVVLHLDGRDDLRTKWPWIVRKCYRIAQSIAVRGTLSLVVDSETVRKELVGDWRRGGCDLIAYGGCLACDGTLRQRSGDPSHQRFLALARSEPENQLHRIVQAFMRSSTRGRLSVVTTTRYSDRYWKSLEQMFVPGGSAELIDGIWDKTVLCHLYRQVSAVIHGHTVGGTNPSLVLALCHGTPVLAHDNKYNREVAGSLARYWKTEEELTKLLDDFDPAMWPYDQAAVDDFNRRYNWDDVVEKYKRVLGLDQNASDEPLDR